MIPLVAIAVLLVLWIVREQLMRALSTPTMHLSLVHDHSGCEALVIDARMGDGRWMLFQVDTGYAGAPVLSTDYLAHGGALMRGGVQRRYVARTEASGERGGDAAVHAFLSRCASCRMFTSGCTMTLASIGAVQQQTTPLILVNSLQLDGRTIDSHSGDLVVALPLPRSPHILTMDYLLHRAPVLLCPARGTLRLRVPLLEQMALRPAMLLLPLELSDGAPVVCMEVGGVPDLRIVVDTGASAPLSLNAAAAARVASKPSAPDAARKVVQRGVNGERVCSDVMHATVRIKDLDLGRMQVLVNQSPTQNADGYAGMGMLRAMDIWIEPDHIGFRRSGLETRDLSDKVLRVGSCAA